MAIHKTSYYKYLPRFCHVFVGIVSDRSFDSLPKVVVNNWKFIDEIMVQAKALNHWHIYLLFFFYLENILTIIAGHFDCEPRGFVIDRWGKTKKKSWVEVK